MNQEKGFVTSIAEDIEDSLLPDKMKALLKLAKAVTASGNNVTKVDIELAKNSGATDTEIHDAILIASMFCMYNRYVDGLGAFTPEEDSPHYQENAKRLAVDGYMAPRPAE